MTYAYCPNSVIAQTYTDSQRIIQRLACRFRKQYGGEIDDLIGEANLGFLRAYKSYDPNKGTVFLTWMHTIVWKHLLEGARTFARRRKRCWVSYREEALIDKIPDKPFNTTKFLIDLSDDARFVAMLALEPNTGVRFELSSMRSRDFYRCLRKSVVIYLRDLGWTREKIERCFQEILDGIFESTRELNIVV